MKVKIKLKKRKGKRKKEMENTIKVRLLSVGVKFGIALILRSVTESLIKEGDSKGMVVGITCMAGAAYIAGCVTTDVLVKKYLED